MEKKTLISKKKSVEKYDIIAGTMQTFWMKKGKPTKKNYGKSKHKDADFYTQQDIQGWSTKPLDEIIPDATLKTLPYGLYSKKGGKSVTYQKQKYSEFTINKTADCYEKMAYNAYIKNDDIVKYSKHAWRDFSDIIESNPTSIGTSAKETLVQARATEINTVPAFVSTYAFVALLLKGISIPCKVHLAIDAYKPTDSDIMNGLMYWVS